MGTDSLTETLARALWEQRIKFANDSGVHVDEWGDGEIPRQCGVYGESQVAIETIAEWILCHGADTDEDASALVWIAGRLRDAALTKLPGSDPLSDPVPMELKNTHTA